SFNAICFLWIIYENEIFQKCIDQGGIDYSFFKSFISKHIEKRHLTIPWLLGFFCENNLKYLQAIVHEQYPELFSNFNRIIYIFEKENIMIRALERKDREIKYDLKHKQTQSHSGIILNPQGKILSLK
ncbi:20282_t:CDS:1, partial [Gigaspora rosea]